MLRWGRDRVLEAVVVGYPAAPACVDELTTGGPAMIMPNVHQFEPEDDIRHDEVFIVAHCSCGWRGSSFPSSGTSSYADARGEWERHQAASRHSTT